MPGASRFFPFFALFKQNGPEAYFVNRPPSPLIIDDT
ncbi:hypothetical protein BF29_568 [Heyndrickxia coagulans DSM 1 = ATCC 7050]|nr:hypothetical protein BF29_568 [Heyndrickxia coagulans DSM 1 = ATCC 7050]